VEQALAAGEPSRPPGYRPQPQARVIAERQGSWWSAVVLGVDDDDDDGGDVTVHFASDGLDLRVARTQVVPEPVQAAAPARGAFVLIRPVSPAEPWKRVRVVSAVDDEVKVVDQDGNERTAAFRDVLTLARRP
jgi:hypothetical protein